MDTATAVENGFPEVPFTLEWYVTHKFPLWDEAGRFIGVAASTLAPGVWRPLCSAISNLTALEHIRTHYSEKISVETLASTAGMSRRSFGVPSRGELRSRQRSEKLEENACCIAMGG